MRFNHWNLRTIWLSIYNINASHISWTSCNFLIQTGMSEFCQIGQGRYKMGQNCQYSFTRLVKKIWKPILKSPRILQFLPYLGPFVHPSNQTYYFIIQMQMIWLLWLDAIVSRFWPDLLCLMDGYIYIFFVLFWRR